MNKISKFANKLITILLYIFIYQLSFNCYSSLIKYKFNKIRISKKFNLKIFFNNPIILTYQKNK